MEEKSSSSSSDNPSTPRVRNAEELEDLVKLLQQNFARFLPSFSAFLNLLRAVPAFSQNHSKPRRDWVDLHDRLLLIPSNYLSTMLGGGQQQSVANRMTGLARLHMICSRSRAGGKLVLETPQDDEDVDVTKLEQLPIMQGKILSSEKNKKTSGDDSGLPVRQLLAISRDQIYYMYLNGACLVVRNSHPDYNLLNNPNRNSYQGAFKALVEGVFSFSEESVLMEKSIELATQREIPKHLHFCDNRPFLDLPLYTSYMIRHYIFSLVALDQNLVSCAHDMAITLEIMVRRVIPELAKLGDREFDLGSMEEFISQVEEWWNNSPLNSIRDTIYPKPLSTNEFLEKYLPNLLSDEIKRPLVQLQDLIAEIQVIRTIHPVDRAHSEQMTPIHEFSYLLLQQSEQLLKEVQAMVQFIGEVDLQQVCSDRTSFLYIYGELRTRYFAMYPTPVRTKSRNGAYDGLAHQSPEVDSHNGSGFFSPAHRATPSPPVTRASQAPQNGAGIESRGKSSSAQSSPRPELTSSTSGQLPKSPRPEYPSSTSGPIPKSPRPESPRSDSRRVDSRRSGSMGADASQSSTGLARNNSGRLNQVVEMTPTPTTASNPGSTKISPAGSAKQSPNGSNRNSPREREQHRGSDQGGSVDITSTKFGGNKQLSYRRRSMAKSMTSATPPAVQNVSYEPPAEYIKK